MSSLIEGIQIEGINPDKTAAMYYKTESFTSGLGRYGHTNNWEIQRAIEILCKRGFTVDLIDRGHDNWAPKKTYDLFLGLGVGNTGRKFVKYSKESKAKKRILLAMGPQPDESNRRVLDRYEMFKRRTGRYAPPMRTVSAVTGPAFEEIIENTDYIFCIGEENTESYKSFLGYGIPVLNFYPGISNKVKFDESWMGTRKRNHFLCFAGNGLICKGVDLVVEAFSRTSENVLHICGPPESAFMAQYGDLISSSENLFYYGFIEPGGQTFNDLASKCSYTIFHSAAEGCCTSVATAMRAGLVPVVNSWTGILINDGVDGIQLSDTGDLIEEIENKINYCSELDDEKYKNLVENNNDHAIRFSQEGFTEYYGKCIERVMADLK